MTTSRSRQAARLGLTLLTSATLAVTGCTAETKNGSEPAPTMPAKADAGTFPGIYLTGDVAVTETSPDRWDLFAAMNCADLEAMLSAGQWRVVDRLAYPPNTATGVAAAFGTVPGVVLSRGDALVFAPLTGGGTSCSGALIKIARYDITVSGKGMPGVMKGWAATTSCLRNDDKSLTVRLYFDTDQKVGGMVSLYLVPSGASYAVNPEDSNSFSVGLVRHDSHLLQIYTRALAAGRELTNAELGATFYETSPGENFKSTVKIDGADSSAPHGLVTVEDMESELGPLAVTVPFACSKVGTF